MSEENKLEAKLIYRYLYSKNPNSETIENYISACKIKKIKEISPKIISSIKKYPILLNLYDQALMFNNEHPVRKRLFVMSCIGECENYEHYYKNESIIIFLLKSAIITLKSALLFIPSLILLKCTEE